MLQNVGDRRATPKEHVPLMLACWGAFIGLIPPVFLTDEIEGIDPKDMLYAGAIGIVGLVVPIITVPTATGTMIRAWSDRALRCVSSQPPRKPSGRGAVFCPNRRPLPAARAERRRSPAGDRSNPRHLRDNRKHRPRLPERSAIPEPYDAHHRPAGRSVAGPRGERAACTARVGLRVMPQPTRSRKSKRERLSWDPARAEPETLRVYHGSFRIHTLRKPESQAAALDVVEHCRSHTVHRVRALPGEKATPLGAAITWVGLTTEARLRIVSVNSASSERCSGQTQV